MDDRRFDALTVRLSSAASRRRLLQALGGSAAGGAIAALGLTRAAAAPPVKLCGLDGSPCDNQIHCCTGQGLHCIKGTCLLRIKK